MSLHINVPTHDSESMPSSKETMFSLSIVEVIDQSSLSKNFQHSLVSMTYNPSHYSHLHEWLGVYHKLPIPTYPGGEVGKGREGRRAKELPLKKWNQVF